MANSQGLMLCQRSDVFTPSRTCHTPDARYQNVSVVSDGIDGTIFHANDTKTNSQVSIKRKVFDSTAFQQVMREAHLLRQLEHENVVVFHGIVHCPLDASDRHQHCYIIQELLDTNLQLVIHSGQMTSGHCKLFTYQLLRGLKYIHSADICHGNLRPDVIQINRKDLTLKICDFGHKVKDIGSCFWYSSPEVIISGKDCTSAADLWSAGCIVAEMATGQPFFQGNGQLELLLKHIDCVHLSDDDWRKVLHVMPNKMLKNHPFRPRRPLRLLLAGLDQNLVQLVDQLLTFSQQQRITAEVALGQPYLEEYYYPEDEPVARLPFRLTEDKVDDVNEGSLLLLLATLMSSSGDDVVRPQDLNLREQPQCLPHGEGALSYNNQQLDNLFSQMAVTGESYRPDVFRHSELSRNEVALKNLRNNQDRIGDDRTPSPNIIDLLNQSFESDPGGYLVSGVKGPSGKMHEADSESEKETAEISEEKFQEDLEVGNITTEDLKRLGNVPACLAPLESVHRPESLPVTSSRSKENVNITASSCSSLVTRRECQKLLKAAEVPAETPIGMNPFVESTRDFKKLELSKNKDQKNLCTGPKTGLHSPLVLVNFPEDSNKYNCDDVDEKQKLKSHSESVQMSRKLILDKIESEKKSQQKSRMTGDLTSEEFDELYRLPTEHLRKDKTPNEIVRHRHSHEWPRCGRHPDDSYDRYGFCKDERLHADGACGGHDYLDDMQASFSRSSIEFDLEPYFPELALERNQMLSLDEPELSTELRFIRPTGQGIAASRDTSSSPESPASPRTIQTGARPKKSPKKHRAV